MTKQDGKYTTISIHEEDKDILDKIKKMERMQSKSEVITKIIQESKYKQINRLIEDKFEDMREMIPPERLKEEKEKLLKLEALYKQVVAQNYKDYKTKQYKKLFEEDEYKEDMIDEYFEEMDDEESDSDLTEKERMILQGGTNTIKGQK